MPAPGSYQPRRARRGRGVTIQEHLRRHGCFPKKEAMAVACFVTIENAGDFFKMFPLPKVPKANSYCVLLRKILKKYQPKKLQKK